MARWTQTRIARELAELQARQRRLERTVGIVARELRRIYARRVELENAASALFACIRKVS